MLTCQRDQFSLPPDAHYLNCAYMSPLGRWVEEAGIEALRIRRSPTEITPADFFRGADRARELFARLVNAPDPLRIAVIPSASYGMAIVARNVACTAGDNMVVASEQFPSNVLPWRSLAARRGLELRTVAPPDRWPRGAEWNEWIEAAIDERTKIVALGHVHWTDGTLFDLERIGARARSYGAALIVDGTQSVGALPFDVQHIRPDALVCASYKWLLGPYSLGLVYLGERFMGGEPLEETWLGRLGSEEFGGLVNYRDEYQPGALRFDMGERSSFSLMPMLNAALERLLQWNPREIQRYCRHLLEPLAREAEALGFQVEDDRWRGGHIIGLRAQQGLDLDVVQRRLVEQRIGISRRGTALRVAPHLYNDHDDIAALIHALRG